MCDDDWVTLAFSDDSLVVDLLLRLHHHLPPPPPPPPGLHLHWTVRQRRSKNLIPPKHEPTRASPTTPLSWPSSSSPTTTATVATALAADGSEDSTKPLKTKTSTKVANPNETTTNKKSRRKKTLAELREEESMLVKERRNLKSELASLRITLEEHRATNERLKRLKVDMESRQHLKTDTIPVASNKVLVNLQPHPSVSLTTMTSSIPRNVVDNTSRVSPENSSCKHEDIDKQEASFVLPDLNLPVDEDLSLITTHGLS